MAQVPNDTRFIGINPTVNLRERRSARINRETQPVSMQDITDSIRPYKVYTALLTQSGSDSPNLVADLPLVPGISYEIINDDSGTADFTNVGAPNNNIGTFFVATGTTPTSWGVNTLGQLQYNSGAPTVTVLENTIGNIYFEYRGAGEYACKSNSLFTENKTTIDIDAYCQNGNPETSLIYRDLDTSTFTIGTYKGELGNDYLYNNRLEIRVYN
jgi:hypothetical protein